MFLKNFISLAKAPGAEMFADESNFSSNGTRRGGNPPPIRNLSFLTAQP